METQHVIMGRAEARDLYRKYKEHKHYSTPVDREVMRAYQLLAQGRPVIKALESIRVAGLNDQGWPELAIAPATAKQVECSLRDNGALAFDARESRSFRTVNEQHLIAERCYFSFPAGSFPRGERRGWWSARAIVPIVPVEHRPARGLANYHVLWEAEWSRTPPRDPFLLRRIGKADLWVVLAMWELSEVERAALATRV